MSGFSLKNLDLDPRERTALLCGVVALFLVIFLLLYIPIGPGAKYEASSERLADLQLELQDARLTKMEAEEELDSQTRLIALMETRPPNFSLYAYVENVLDEMSLRDAGRASLENYRSSQASPKQPMVQMSLEGISLEELVELLHTLYSSQNLVAVYEVGELSPAPNGRGLNCNLILVTLNV